MASLLNRKYGTVLALLRSAQRG
uniref:Uncharacterized protein n=1 Tax=Anguilla anguilla TaxID=7936 RepID=A0A0E9R4C1_ANGAN